MEIDLSGLNRKELTKLRARIDKQMERLSADQQKAALEAAEKAAMEHGYSLSELAGMTGKTKRRGKAGSVNPPKYRNPEDPTQTWTGRGRRPQWIKDAEVAGTDLSTFEI